MSTKTPGHIAAGYLYSILPDRVRSHVLNRLNRRERSRINEGLSLARRLTGPERVSILRTFVRRMRAMEGRRRRIKEQSMLASLGSLGAIACAATAAAFALRQTTDGRIDFIEAILTGGGMHLALLPAVAGYLRAEFGQNPPAVLFSSHNRLLDTALAACGGLCLAALFLLLPEGGGGYSDPPLRIVTLLLSVTAGPAVEELVFRHLLFRLLGETIGHGAAAAVSSLLFSVIHVPDSALAFAAYLASGLALCALCHARRALYPALVTHALSNLFIQVF
ncbi:MAG: CPBP family intramembrane metalloprotease [Spirochaetes bacterium]|nr:CPBP family intramembrane metalloprotease [Spirochaetota bacterium]